jgi:ABC-type Fe3+-hydroxamate transport system substrate-binding protein
MRLDMNMSITVTAVAALVLAACAPSPPPAAAAPAASIMPRPTENYTCERGTKLSVKLLGETAVVGVDGADAVSLPALGEDGTTFTNGRQTLYVKQGVVSWAIGRMAAETCKPD